MIDLKKIIDIYPDGKKQAQTLSLETEKLILSMIPEKANYTLIAVGGLGRNEQGIHSDLDLLFLIEDWKYEKEPMEVLRKFWDLDLKLGYSIRTIENVFQHAREDITFFTTIIFTRLLYGNSEFYEKFLEAKKAFFFKNRSFLFTSIYPELKKLSYIEKDRTILFNQPQLKNGFAGLRGFQTVKWFLEIYPEYRELEQTDSYQKAAQSYYFLWAVRDLASFLTERSISQLQIEILEKLVVYFGFKKLFEAEEFLMKIFHSFSHIYDLLLLLKEKMEKDLPMKKNLFSFFKRKKEDTQITVVNNKVFLKEESVENYLQAVLYAVRTDFELSESLIKKAQLFFSEPISLNPAEKEIFKDFFQLESKLYPAFYYLHIMNFLSAYFPEYKKMIYRPQLDFYHSFSLGQHSIITLKQISSLYQKEHPFFSKILRELSFEEKETLIYALLLHDIGKIMEGNHIHNNQAIIDSILSPLPLSLSQKKDIAFLVIQHLVMANTCQRKDINRIKTILGFASEVHSPKLLKLLLILTIADIQAVSDNKLSSFMESSLFSLYLKTNVILSGKQEEQGLFEEERRQIEDAVSKDFPDKKEKIMALFPEEYFIEIDNQEIKKDIQIIETYDSYIDIQKEQDILKFKYYGKDEKGLLSKIVAGFTLNHLNILDSKVYTLSNGMVLDYFYCNPLLENLKDPGEEEKKNLRKQILTSVSENKSHNIQLFANKLYYWAKKANLVEIETLIELRKIEENLYYLFITARDFPGILYFITDFLKENSFYIIKAKINTVGLRIYDAFYIRSIDSSQNINEEEIKEKLDFLIKDLKNKFELK
ncbi:MAG TPA: hypothetical protein DHW82_07910 [Spirochaetia bacterium]|nr:MAG: hypothetical protein A2Y41_08175 [Spirochaetes bacterium GWB1_36_13]HCL56917.1 hypothetical protein [Spirochaetia bacterium]